MYAVMGKVLIVDLTKKTFQEEIIDSKVYETYIGGAGLAAYLLNSMIPAGADPLGPENVLAFMSGALTATGSLMTGRWMVCTKSPLTGGWGDANCGGNLSPAIKQCGWDGILFKGRAQEPVVFIADENGPRLESAGNLWGLDAIETEQTILASWKGKRQPAVAVIGPAAEHVSLISGISNDGGRYAARSGVGAVMGSKKLKAIILSGSKKVETANPEKIKALSKQYAEFINKAQWPNIASGKFLKTMGKALSLPVVLPVPGAATAMVLKKWGTTYNNTVGIVNGDSPIKNWTGSVKDFGQEKFEKLNPDKIIARETKKYRCYSCVIGCGGICDITGLNLKGDHTHKPEYETCCAFGPLLMNDDLDTIFICNDLCNRAGLDTISAGSVIAFAIECYENGILSKEDTDGLELTWGNSTAIIALLKKIINREGFGALLADGSRKAAERIGKGSEKFAVHAGGQEPGMHDGRYDPLMGVAYMADPTPGRHTIAASVYYNVSRLWDFVSWAPPIHGPYSKKSEYEDSEREALKALAFSLLKQVLDAAGGCLFAVTTGLKQWPFFEWLNAATGIEKSPQEWLEAGKAIQSIRMEFNKKEGVEPGQVFVHPRIYGEEPLESGPLKGRKVPLQGLVKKVIQRITNSRK